MTAIAADVAAGTGAIVRDMVRQHRCAGLKAEAAMAETAGELGLTVRRVRAYCYGEVCAVLAGEYLAIRRRFAAHLEREERRLVAQAAALRARRAALER